MIKYEIKNNTAVITLNRPDKRNALNSELVALIKEKFSEAESDDSIKSIILTGEGKAFCAGADLEYLSQIKNNSAVENEKDSRSLAEMFLKIYNCKNRQLLQSMVLQLLVVADLRQSVILFLLTLQNQNLVIQKLRLDLYLQ